MEDSNEVIGGSNEPLHQQVSLSRVPEVAGTLTNDAAGLLLRLLPPLHGVAEVALDFLPLVVQRVELLLGPLEGTSPRTPCSSWC